MVARPPRTSSERDCVDAASNALKALLARLPYAPGKDHPTQVVRRAALARSKHLRDPEYRILATRDVDLLFELYDEHAFDGLLRRLLPKGPPSPLWFRLSKRMTRIAGKTIFHPPPRECSDQPGVRHPIRHGVHQVEIALSVPLLLWDLPPGGGAKVVGLETTDRLDALQRVIEHELIHVFERLTRGETHCSRRPFQIFSKTFFGHRAHRHELGTPRTSRLSDPTPTPTGAPPGQPPPPPVAPGDRVRFAYDGAVHEGIVNRITRRATVLVRDPGGCRYTDGESYRKYYVPLPMLERLETA